jgi:hypothetical protein
MHNILQHVLLIQGHCKLGHLLMDTRERYPAQSADMEVVRLSHLPGCLDLSLITKKSCSIYFTSHGSEEDIIEYENGTWKTTLCYLLAERRLKKFPSINSVS